MGKISPVSIKYMIYANFEAEGTLEKPDVIGAIFGQTEGLLGEDLELRELQKEGKIGRIEVELKSENGKTFGKIEIPSALDKTDTTLIAAAIETIERIGPSNAKIVIEKIEDVRQNKREYILKRAKELLEKVSKEAPHSKEIKEKVVETNRINKIKEYGEEKLPAGNIEGKEVIVVEGRADVVNLVKEGIDNVIGMNGTKLPETIKELSKDKKITLFLDGDRGGRLIAKNVINNADVDYVAFAPDGKEVEELREKEILQCLRKKIPVEDFLNPDRRKGPVKRQKVEGRGIRNRNTKKTADIDINKFVSENKDKLKEILDEATRRKKIFLVGDDLRIVKRVMPLNLYKTLENARNVLFIVVDKATQNIIKLAEKKNIKGIIANNFTSTSNNVELISL